LVSNFLGETSKGYGEKRIRNKHKMWRKLKNAGQKKEESSSHIWTHQQELQIKRFRKRVRLYLNSILHKSEHHQERSTKSSSGIKVWPLIKSQNLINQTISHLFIREIGDLITLEAWEWGPFMGLGGGKNREISKGGGFSTFFFSIGGPLVGGTTGGKNLKKSLRGGHKRNQKKGGRTKK